jgi:hypothetical protein
LKFLPSNVGNDCTPQRILPFQTEHVSGRVFFGGVPDKGSELVLALEVVAREIGNSIAHLYVAERIRDRPKRVMPGAAPHSLRLPFDPLRARVHRSRVPRALLIASRDGRAKLELAGYVLLAFAVMTKGPVALVLVGLLCGMAWLAGGGLRD